MKNIKPVPNEKEQVKFLVAAGFTEAEAKQKVRALNAELYYEGFRKKADEMFSQSGLWAKIREITGGKKENKYGDYYSTLFKEAFEQWFYKEFHE